MGWRKNETVLSTAFAILLFVGFINCTPAIAQEPLDKERWEQVIKNYDYGDIEIEQKEIKNNKTKENMPEKPTWSINPEVLKVVSIGIIIVLLTLLVLHLMGIKLINKKITLRKTVTYDQEGKPIEPDPIYETQFERELRLALENKNYRKAIRIYFVTIVDELAVARMIKKEKDKTNQKYINELRGTKEQKPFKKLVRLFEIIWYGEIALDEKEYRRLAPEFDNFLQKLTRK